MEKLKEFARKKLNYDYMNEFLPDMLEKGYEEEEARVFIHISMCRSLVEVCDITFRGASDEVCFSHIRNNLEAMMLH